MTKPRKRLTRSIIILVIVLLPLYWFVSVCDTLGTARARASSQACHKGLVRIGEALKIYRNLYGGNPPSLDKLADEVPAVNFELACFHWESNEKRRKAPYIWNPSGDEICKDSEPHIIAPKFFFWNRKEETNILRASGEVETRIE